MFQPVMVGGGTLFKMTSLTSIKPVRIFSNMWICAAAASQLCTITGDDWEAWVLHTARPLCCCQRARLLPDCGYRGRFQKWRVSGRTLQGCLEDFPHHHPGSRVQLNQSAWSSWCLVTCGCWRSILRRPLGVLETSLEQEHVVTNVRVDRRGQTVKGFVFSTNLSGLLRKKADLWDPEFLPTHWFFSQ